jgi:hypothetical protein
LTYPVVFHGLVFAYTLLANPADFTRLNDECATIFPTKSLARAGAKLGVELANVLVSIEMTAAL